MSHSDSFIEEVTEEVRRDRLFGYLRRYGWIAVALVLLLVGGAAYNEYSKAQTRAASQARGDAILAALNAHDRGERAANLAKVEGAGDAAPVLAMLLSAEAEASGDAAGAAAALQAVMSDESLPALYRELATLKHIILTASETPPSERIAALQALTAPGAPFRILAEEQVALAEVESGDTEAALSRLRALLEDTEASQGLRQRVTQLIVALGGSTDPA